MKQVATKKRTRSSLDGKSTSQLRQMFGKEDAPFNDSSSELSDDHKLIYRCECCHHKNQDDYIR